MGSNKIREGVTELSHGGARILDIKIWGGLTNLNHTTPRSQSRWGEAYNSKLFFWDPHLSIYTDTYRRI